MAVRLEQAGGLVVGKLIKYALDKLGIPKYEVMGIDLRNFLTGLGLTGVSYFYGYRLGRFEDVVGFAGAQIIVDECAKAAGIEAKPAVVIVRKPAPAAVRPAPKAEEITVA